MSLLPVSEVERKMILPPLGMCGMAALRKKGVVAPVVSQQNTGRTSG
jgi:hypothetical protein